MKRFAFPLERVLALRRQQLQVEESKLETILADRRLLVRQRLEIQERVRISAAEVLSKLIVETIELQALQGFRAFSTARETALGTQIADCDTRAAEQRIRISEVRRSQKLIEKLRERHLTQWQAAFQKELEEQAAESFLARWNRERSAVAAKAATRERITHRVR